MLEKLRQLLPDPVIKEEDLELYKKARGLYIADPWERVKTIFQLDDYKNMHPELTRAIQIGQLGIVFGGAMGGLKQSVRQSREFIRTNDMKIYSSSNDMYRKLSNKSIEAFIKGIVKTGPKVGLFAGGFSLVSSCCEAYRNKSGVLEYVVGGYIAGGVSRSAFGIKGFVAGGIFGAILGLILGTMRIGLEKLTKTDSVTLKYAHYALANHRKQMWDRMKMSSKVDVPEKMLISIHGQHTSNPLNEFDVKD